MMNPPHQTQTPTKCLLTTLCFCPDKDSNLFAHLLIPTLGCTFPILSLGLRAFPDHTTQCLMNTTVDVRSMQQNIIRVVCCCFTDQEVSTNQLFHDNSVCYPRLCLLWKIIAFVFSMRKVSCLQYVPKMKPLISVSVSTCHCKESRKYICRNVLKPYAPSKRLTRLFFVR